MAQLLHVFRNTPFGRETLLQSAYFCRQLNVSLCAYVPTEVRFLMYFENDVIQIDLDQSYLSFPATAAGNLQEVCQREGIEAELITPGDYTASSLPNIPTSFTYMCCPRSVSDLSSKIGLGHIGPRVRRIVQCASFPVLIPSPVYKPWRSLVVLLGGSANAKTALRLGLFIASTTGMPLDLFTFIEQGRDRAYLESRIAEEGLEEILQQHLGTWHECDKGEMTERLWDVQHDALVILGAYGHGLIKELMFGSTIEKVQSTVTNNLLVVGPQCDLREPATWG